MCAHMTLSSSEMMLLMTKPRCVLLLASSTMQADSIALDDDSVLQFCTQSCFLTGDTFNFANFTDFASTAKNMGA